MPLAFSMNSGGVLAWKLFLNELLFFEFLEMIINRVYFSSTPMDLFKRSMSFSQSGSFSEFFSGFMWILNMKFIFGLIFPYFSLKPVKIYVKNPFIFGEKNYNFD